MILNYFGFDYDSLVISVVKRFHTKVKPFNCPCCGLGFSVECNLKADLETHKSMEEKSSSHLITRPTKAERDMCGVVTSKVYPIIWFLL